MIGEVVLILYCLVMLVDLVCYTKAKFPERMKWRLLPIGSGFLALYLYGRNKR